MFTLWIRILMELVSDLDPDPRYNVCESETQSFWLAFGIFECCFRWKETQWNTNQQAVHSQVSAMNAATAQMVSHLVHS